MFFLNLPRRYLYCILEKNSRPWATPQILVFFFVFCRLKQLVQMHRKYNKKDISTNIRSSPDNYSSFILEIILVLIMIFIILRKYKQLIILCRRHVKCMIYIYLIIMWRTITLAIFSLPEKILMILMIGCYKRLCKGYLCYTMMYWMRK